MLPQSESTRAHSPSTPTVEDTDTLWRGEQWYSITRADGDAAARRRRHQDIAVAAQTSITRGQCLKGSGKSAGTLSWQLFSVLQENMCTQISTILEI